VVPVVGLVFGAAWIVWRCTSSLGGAPVWLSTSALIVEVVGFAAALVLVWALWPGSVDRQLDVVPDEGGFDDAVTVVVRCHTESIDAVRATLLAARQVGSVILVDESARSRRDLIEFGETDGVPVRHCSDTGSDPLVAIARDLSSPAMVVLDAGQIAAPDLVARLAPWMAPDVAVVQGDVVAVDDAGSDRRPLRRRFEQVLNAGLGARGAAQFTGGGALVRTAALAALWEAPYEPVVGRAMRQMQTTLALFSDGWRVVAPGEPVVAAPQHAPTVSHHPALAFSARGGVRATDPVVVERARAESACAARLGLSAALAGRRRSELALRNRLALMAWATVPLSGIRRSLLAAVLAATLLQGELPFRLAFGPVLGLWLPWLVLTSVGLWSLSGGALRPGDRSVEATVRAGASWRGLTTPNGDLGSGRSPLGLLLGLDHSAGAVVLVGGLSIVVGLRGLSDRLTHTLRPLGTAETVAVLVVTLWVLAAGLSTLRMLTLRPLRPRSVRVATSLGSVFAGVPAMVADISTRGAAVVGPIAAQVGDAAELELVVPTSSGCVSARLSAVVRHAGVARAGAVGAGVAAGERRVGIEFVDVPAHVRDVLIEFCLVQPALVALSVPGAMGSPVGASGSVAAAGRSASPQWVGLRIAVMTALVGAAASASAPAVRATSGRAVQQFSEGVLGDPTRAGWEQQPALRWLVPTVTVLLAAPVLVGLLAAPVVGRRRDRPQADHHGPDMVSLGRRPRHLSQ
jgi:hypothetical protein